MSCILKAQKVELNNINFSLFENSNDAPASSYKNGKLIISIDYGSEPVFLIQYFSSNGKEIVCRGFTSTSLYALVPEESKKTFRIRNLYALKENYSHGQSMVFQMCQLCIDRDDKPFTPMAIYLQIFNEKGLFLSSTVGFSSTNWDKLVTLYKKYLKYLH